MPHTNIQTSVVKLNIYAQSTAMIRPLISQF